MSAKYLNILTNTTTAVKASQGRLESIIINTAGASSNTITVYDNTAGSGTKVGTINGTAAAGSVFQYGDKGIQMETGITIVTATGTCADITVVYE